MKRCPKCNLTFSDDNSFCLFDGTPLLELYDDSDAVTVIRPPAAPQSPNSRLSRVLVFGLFAIGALLLLLIGLLVSLFTSNRGNSESITDANINASKDLVVNSPKPVRDATPAQSNRTLESVKQELDQVERERQKLADARKRLDEEKRITNRAAPPAKINSGDQQTVRIKFRPGRVEESLSGTVASRRSFVLYTLRDQDLAARVRSANDCVVFDTGSTQFNTTTKIGDTFVNLKNNCGGTVKFGLSVYVR